MISTATILACTVTLIISLVLPVLAIFLYAANNKGKKLISAWFLGAAGFFVTQILIRVPILTFLQTQDWFLTFSQNHTFVYVFSLAFTAGLFELIGRFAIAKLLSKKNLTYARSLAAGLGHGGIEAMLLVGTAYINNILYCLMINSGTFDTLISQAAATGVDVTQLYTLRDSLIQTHPALFLLAGFERILAMTCHAGMSMVVCYSLHSGKIGKGILICLGIHTMIDLTTGISLLSGTVLSQGAAYFIIYAILTTAALLSIWIIRDIRKRWIEKEVSHESETA